MVAEGIRMARLSIAALALALGACGAGERPARPVTPAPAPAAPTPSPAPAAETKPAPVRLFTDAELSAYETGLLGRVAGNATLVCKRPVLRGTPAAGPADADIVAIVEPSGALADCFRDTQALETASAKLRDVIASRTPATLELVKRCGPLFEAAIAKAIAHEDACSPYAAGRRVEPPSWMLPIAMAHVVGLQAQLRAEGGDNEGAMWLVAESARMFQDLGRGRPYILPPMIGTAGTRIVLDATRAIVDKLTRKQAARFVPVFDALVASEPRFGDVLLGEAQYLGLLMGLANLKGADWVPPGGTRPELQKENRVAGDSSLDPLDEAGVLVAIAEMLEHDVTTACPGDATYKTCIDGLHTLDANAKPPAARREDLVKMLHDKTTVADTPEQREKVRLEMKAMVIDIAANVARPSYAAYVARRAMGVARLAATRIAIGVRHTGKCPTTVETNPTLGDALVLEREGKSLAVSVPEWSGNKDRPDDNVVRTIQCPRAL